MNHLETSFVVSGKNEQNESLCSVSRVIQYRGWEYTSSSRSFFLRSLVNGNIISMQITCRKRTSRDWGEGRRSIIASPSFAFSRPRKMRKREQKRLLWSDLFYELMNLNWIVLHNRTSSTTKNPDYFTQNITWSFSSRSLDTSSCQRVKCRFWLFIRCLQCVHQSRQVCAWHRTWCRCCDSLGNTSSKVMIRNTTNIANTRQYHESISISIQFFSIYLFAPLLLTILIITLYWHYWQEIPASFLKLFLGDPRLQILL